MAIGHSYSFKLDSFTSGCRLSTPNSYSSNCLGFTFCRDCSGSVVFAQAALQARASIGTGVILNTGCSVDHDAKISEGVHLCPGSRLSGEVVVGYVAGLESAPLLSNKYKLVQRHRGCDCCHPRYSVVRLSGLLVFFLHID